MKMIFKNPRIFQGVHAGPLGSSIESYAAEMREQGYCAGGRRLVAFGLLPTCKRIWSETFERSRMCETWRPFVVF